MQVEIITIGDELMSGEVVDTNFSWLAERLWLRGYDLHWHTSVSDQPHKMREAFQVATRSDVVVVTGGLGPTSDDRTLAVAAETFGRKLVEDPEALVAIRQRLQELGRELTTEQRKQVLYPEGGKMFPNREGTAPGCFLEVHGTHFIFLVGVPSEMYKQWENDVLPYLESLGKKPLSYRHEIFRCFGKPEADLQKDLRDFNPADIRLSFRLHFPEVLVKLASWGENANDVEQKLAAAAEEVRARIGRTIYATGDNPIEKVIGRLLTERNETVAVAESCTGGLLANLITEVSGSSAYFQQAVVTYSNQSKETLLGVKRETLEKYGAVSAEVATEMASGIRERAKTTYGLAVTGIAGPSGGSAEKPVGTVHVALATPQEIKEKKYFFPFGRHWFKLIVAHVALHKLRRYLTT